MKASIVIVIVAVLCLLPYRLSASTCERGLTIYGIVSNAQTHLPVPGATVDTVGDDACAPARTDVRGEFGLRLVDNIKFGDLIRIRAAKEGYEVLDQMETVSPKPLPLSISPKVLPNKHEGGKTSGPTKDSTNPAVGQREPFNIPKQGVGEGENEAPKPISVQFSIESRTKKVTIHNYGREVRELRLRLTRYTFNSESLSHMLESQEVTGNDFRYTQMPQLFLNVDSLPRGSVASVDLGSQPELMFVNFPSSEPYDCYAMRFTFRDSETGKTYAFYEITSVERGALSIPDNPEDVNKSGPGTPVYNPAGEIPREVIKHQINNVYQDTGDELYLAAMTVSIDRARLQISDVDGPLVQREFPLEASAVINLREVQIENEGNRDTSQKISVYVDFSEKITPTVRFGWIALSSSDKLFPLEFHINGPILSPSSHWSLPQLQFKRERISDKAVAARMTIFYGEPEPKQIYFWFVPNQRPALSPPRP
jgi:hypothetical protein